MDIIKEGVQHVTGLRLNLRLVQSEDADYIFRLRTDPAFNTHLSAVNGTADDQRRWIENYKVREARGEELYYIIERLDGVRCGTVRLYDISAGSFTWGSWILDSNKPRKAALESAVLSFSIGFDELSLERGLVAVNIGNDRAEAFYRRLGMIETHRSAHEIFFVYPRAKFEADRAGYRAILGEVTGE
ncbi:MAG: GNAT family N-acetyltransferase [Hyphomicrobiaceae bacterium]|nr:GNAT family N-acetyltransferase [Hyphomicrobiaceae bacterium]